MESAWHVPSKRFSGTDHGDSPLTRIPSEIKSCGHFAAFVWLGRLPPVLRVAHCVNSVRPWDSASAGLTVGPAPYVRSGPFRALGLPRVADLFIIGGQKV